MDTANLLDDLIARVDHTPCVYAGHQFGRASAHVRGDDDSGTRRSVARDPAEPGPAAPTVVRRGIARGDLPSDAWVTLLPDTLFAGASCTALAPSDDVPVDNRAVGPTCSARLVDLVLASCR
jgi:hypothetical protein